MIRVSVIADGCFNTVPATDTSPAPFRDGQCEDMNTRDSTLTRQAFRNAVPPTDFLNTHSHTVLTAIFPGEAGLTGCPLNSVYLAQR